MNFGATACSLRWGQLVLEPTWATLTIAFHARFAGYIGKVIFQSRDVMGKFRVLKLYSPDRLDGTRDVVPVEKGSNSVT